MPYKYKKRTNAKRTRKTYRKRPTKLYQNVSTTEYKRADTISSPIAFNTTPAVVALNAISTGDDAYTREGRKIVMTAVQGKWTGYVTSATGVQQTHRYMLVYDKSPNGVIPTIDEILEDIPYYLSAKNPANHSRFIVLMDKVISYPKCDVSGSNKSFSFYKRMRLQTIFNDDPGANDMIEHGGLYFVVMGSENAGNTAGAGVSHWRVTFTDG